eukprot:10971364-Karenia_brevis.AAC.1
MSPRCGQVGASWAKLGQVGAQLRPSWGQVGPSWAPVGHKSAQVEAEVDQHSHAIPGDTLHA